MTEKTDAEKIASMAEYVSTLLTEGPATCEPGAQSTGSTSWTSSTR
jgi:hypothetical protein